MNEHMAASVSRNTDHKEDMVWAVSSLRKHSPHENKDINVQS